MEHTLFIPSRKSIRRAGDILRNPNRTAEEFSVAMSTLSQWRQLHSYPINTFQAYFRKITKQHYPEALVAQRLKRTPSIINKLQRFPSMNLDRMQDICGFRIILPQLADIYTLHDRFSRSKRFKHELVLPPKDYIKFPKADGYRSLHQVFKYNNTTHPELNDLRMELQLRTALQHAWATAVETLGIVEKSSFKTGEGSDKFKEFFLLSSQLFALFEEKKEFDSFFEPRVFLQQLQSLEDELKISQKLSGLAISAKHIESTSKDFSEYHLVKLDMVKNEISLSPFTESQLELAEFIYSKIEEEHRDNPNFAVVLISAGNLAQIKRAYPNYFLDTKKFISQLAKYKKKLTNRIA